LYGFVFKIPALVYLQNNTTNMPYRPALLQGHDFDSLDKV